MLEDYSTSASSTPSCFLHRTILLGNQFLTTSLLDLLFLLLFWTIIPAILPAMMLGYYSWVHLRCPLNFFIVVSIYWKPASYRSSLDLSSFGKTSNRSAAKLNSLFFLSFGLTCMLFDLSIALHDLSKVVAPTPCSGACETWVPLGPHRPGSRSSLTSRLGLPEDPPTCLWAQPTWFAAHTTSWRPSRRLHRLPNPLRPQDLAYKTKASVDFA
jgi:hypothetical protein